MASLAGTAYWLHAMTGGKPAAQPFLSPRQSL
ncbi:hypothetical protein Y075_19470 [Salmonella enterica subsp. enterica serovar Infantis str. CVM N23791]|nr:hypothetical protein Y075_19470 [Salmonella enterica subsp. enterica serovar Infantis str. CVM N23791]